jgi:hypothetical protein
MMKAKTKDPPVNSSSPSSPKAAVQVMRWQIGGSGWPCGQFLVPPSTIIEAEVRDGEIAGPVLWNGNKLPMPPPLDAVGLDDAAALFLLRAYPEELWHRLQFSRDLDRGSLLARALHRARWP